MRREVDVHGSVRFDHIDLVDENSNAFELVVLEVDVVGSHRLKKNVRELAFLRPVGGACRATCDRKSARLSPCPRE
jgi:hypothetical protein